MAFTTVKYSQAGRAVLYDGHDLASAHIVLTDAWKRTPEEERKDTLIVVFSDAVVEKVTEGNAVEIIDKAQSIERGRR